MTWSQAQQYCREHHTDLASVRNDRENRLINAIVGSDAAWIGLHRTLSWSDKSNSTFVSFGTSMDDFTMYRQQSCVALWYENSGGWALVHCDQALPSICYNGELHHTGSYKMQDAALALGERMWLTIKLKPHLEDYSLQ